MPKLSVNLNKLATLRNSRGKNNPDLLRAALDLIGFGAEGITVHPRPDERHIRRSDVKSLKVLLAEKFPLLEFNIEGYPSADYLAMVNQVHPQQATLVPDPPEALTSNAGWQVSANVDLLREACRTIQPSQARISVFIDPKTIEVDEFRLLRSIGVDRVELYTEEFAQSFGGPEAELVLLRYQKAATHAREAGLGVNAGHDLDSQNLATFVAAIPWLDEVSIGHALICEALYLGFESTVKKYLQAIRDGRQAAKPSEENGTANVSNRR